MIKVDSVIRKYGSFTAVDRVSFEISPGEIVGFLGPNGSGKTTLMRVMTNYLLPTNGTVYYDSVDITQKPREIMREVGYLPESNILYPQMRVDEYLTFIGRVRGLEGARLKERFSWVVDNMKIEQVLNKRCMECSKGYKQRVSLASVLIHDPKYVLLDEPTVGLDPLQIFMVRDVLKLLSKDRIVLFSSHILQEVAAMTQRVIIIHEGKQIGDVKFDAVENRTETLEKLFADAVTNSKKAGSPL